jgi:hypothetical protein
MQNIKYVVLATLLETEITICQLLFGIFWKFNWNNVVTAFPRSVFWMSNGMKILNGASLFMSEVPKK